MTASLADIGTRLDAIAAQGRQIAMWWRDDDAVTSTPELDGLIARAARHDVPIALAVIPKLAEAGLADRLQAHPHVSVHQHGFAHDNHAPQGSKKAEFGPHRPLDEMMRDLFEGYRRMSSLFGPRFAHVLTPPWNRITPDLAARRKEAGLVGLSTFGPAPDGARHQVNTHIDPIDWRRGKRFLGLDPLRAVLAREIDRRIDGSDEPLGLLTHHLVQTDDAWAFIDDLLALTATHPAVVWPHIEDLFDLR